MIHPGQQEDRQRVIARLEDDEQLSASGGWHEKGIAGEWVQGAPEAPCLVSLHPAHCSSHTLLS